MILGDNSLRSRFVLRTRVFNVSVYRRKVGGSEDAQFFDVAKSEELTA